eukprot:7688638-Pyramimonas_sp.AAC.2
MSQCAGRALRGRRAATVGQSQWLQGVERLPVAAARTCEAIARPVARHAIASTHDAPMRPRWRLLPQRQTWIMPWRRLELDTRTSSL